MRMASIVMIPLLLLFLAIWAGLIYLLILLIRALRKYLRGGEARRERAETRRTLGEVLKAHRMRCQMTQEFVAEVLGVSRQAVSKWETGTADPSTSNLLALAKLFGVPAEELLRETAGGGEVAWAFQGRKQGQPRGRRALCFTFPWPTDRPGRI